MYFSFLWGGYLGLEFLGHMANLGLTFGKLQTCFPKWQTHFAFSNLIGQMRTSKLQEECHLPRISQVFGIRPGTQTHISEACAFNCQADLAPRALDFP